MKVTIEADCTPEEARRFMGLPDMAPVHAAYVARMEEMVRSGGSELFIETLKHWGPMGEQSMALWQQMIGELTGAGGDKKRPRG